MKILLVNDFWNGGGCEGVFRNTFDFLNKSPRFEVKLWYGEKDSIKPAEPVSYIYSRHRFWEMVKILSDFSPDIVHIHNYYHVLSPSVLHAVQQYKKLNPACKLVVTAHDYHLIFPNAALNFFENGEYKIFNKCPAFSDIFFKKLDRRGWLYSFLKAGQWFFAYRVLQLRNAIDHVISPSYFLKSKLETLGELLLPVEVIRNPVNPEFLNIRHINRKHSPPLKMVFLGRVAPEKGLSELFDMIKSLDKSIYTLDIYGDGDAAYIEHLKAVLLQNNLQQNISFKGYFSSQHIADVLSGYHTAILPSLWYENAPLSIIEAGLCGLDIITVGMGGMREMAEIVGNAYFFNHHDPGSLQEAVRSSYNNLQSRQSRIDAGEIDRMFSYEKQLTDFYFSISGD